MKKLLMLIGLFLLTGCTATIVWAPKSVNIHQEGRQHGAEAATEITGSDIDDLQGSQAAEGSVDGLPIGQ